MDWEANGREQQTRWHQLIAEAWDDAALRQRLVADPKTVLKDRGLEVKDDVELTVLQNTATHVYLTIPMVPGDTELSEEELGHVAGGRKRPTPKPQQSTCNGPNASCSPTDPRGTI